MTQFIADIAGMLEVFAIAAALVLLHKASKEAPAKLLKAAGLVLVVGGGIAVGLCTSWYWFKYQAAGEFESAASCHAPMAAGSMPGPHMMPVKHGDQPLPMED